MVIISPCSKHFDGQTLLLEYAGPDITPLSFPRLMTHRPPEWLVDDHRSLEPVINFSAVLSTS